MNRLRAARLAVAVIAWSGCAVHQHDVGADGGRDAGMDTGLGDTADASVDAAPWVDAVDTPDGGIDALVVGPGAAVTAPAGSLVYEDPTVTCPPVDYTFRAPRPNHQPGEVMWVRFVGRTANRPRLFNPYTRPVIHPSGAVTMSTDFPRGLVTWDANGNELPSRPVLEGATNDNFLSLVSRGNDDVIWDDIDRFPPYYEQRAPVSNLSRDYADMVTPSSGLYWQFQAGFIQQRCIVDGRLKRVYGRGVEELRVFADPFSRELIGLVEDDGPPRRQNWGHFDDEGRLVSGEWRLWSEEGGRGFPVLGCGFQWVGERVANGVYAAFGYRTRDRDPVVRFRDPRGGGWNTTADCGAYNADTGLRYGASGELLWIRDSLRLPLGTHRFVSLADGATLFVSTPYPPGIPSAVTIVERTGSVRFRREYVPLDFHATDGIPEFTDRFEIAPNGVMYMIMAARGSFGESQALAAIYLGPIEVAGPQGQVRYLGSTNWAHTNSILPDAWDAYLRHRPPPSDAGLDASSDGSVEDGGMIDAGAVDPASLDAGVTDAGIADTEVGGGA